MALLGGRVSGQVPCAWLSVFARTKAAWLMPLLIARKDAPSDLVRFSW